MTRTRQALSVVTTAAVLLGGLSVGAASPASALAPNLPAGNLDWRALQTPDQSPSIRSVPGNPKLTFYWGLKRNDKGAIAALASVSNPSSSAYRSFQSARATANQFGASKGTVSTVRTYLKKQGIQGKLDKSRLFLRVVGRADKMERAFGEIQFVEDDGIIYYAPTKNPSLPAKIRQLAPQRIWAGQKQVAVGNGADRVLTRKLPKTAQNRAGTPSFPMNDGTFIGCESLKATLLPLFSMTFPQGTKAYGTDKIRPGPSARGDIAKRPPIGIIAMGSGYSDELVAQAKACMGFKGTPYRVETDGISALPSGGEGNLDVQTVLTALKNPYRVPVFESSGDATSFLAPAAALASNRTPRVLTISYGQCEAQTNKAARQLSDSIYQRLGLIGTSVLAAAGDRGSSGCINNETGTGPKKAAVSYPSSSPWVTAIGGTRIILDKSNRRKNEVAWNDSAWGERVGGGGGISTLYARPSWQKQSVTGGSKRSVPDLSAHASLFPGWYVFGDGVIGGTSAATPLTASGIALLNERLIAKRQPSLGLLNPLLYKLPRSATYDIKRGNTDLFNVGCCTAKKGYDRATGIGSPNFATWLKAIPRAR